MVARAAPCAAPRRAETRRQKRPRTWCCHTDDVGSIPRASAAQGAEASEHKQLGGGDATDDSSAILDRAMMMMLTAGWLSEAAADPLGPYPLPRK